MVNDDIKLMLSAQRALTSHITPKIRAISLDISPEKSQIVFRAYTDGGMHESALEELNIALTEIIADHPSDWEFLDEIIVLPEPENMNHLRLLVYLRCEDKWVVRD
jgi:hypothetical protein